MNFPRMLLAVLLLAGLSFADAKPNAPKPPNSATNAILPATFGGWNISSPQTSKDPAVADPTNAALLKEYGFTDYEGATYARDDGRKLSIKAARFQDASGAYGAFTFYKTPEMSSEKIGDQGYSLYKRVLFYRGNIVVDAAFEQLSAMSAAELRELADDLPRPAGPNPNLPPLPTYLPDHVKNTARYIVGPVALERGNSPLPAQLVDFTQGAEVVFAHDNVSGTPATLMLISYPTPQIAAAQLKLIDAAAQQHQLGNVQIATRRTGPIIIVVSGALSAGDAKSLLTSVNYDADVTWNQNTYFTRRDNVANLIVGVILLAAIIGGLSIVAGVAFGGFRLAIKRLFPNKVFDRPEQMEIIALHLSDRGSEAPDSR